MDDDAINKIDKSADQTSFGDAAMDLMARVSQKLSYAEAEEGKTSKKDEKSPQRSRQSSW